MPTQVQVGIWNVGCSVGTVTPMQTLMNFTGTLVHEDRFDIHIILSASTDFKPDFACVREGGIVCHADSSAAPAVYQKVRGVMVPGAAVGVSDINPSLNAQLAQVADDRRKDHTRAVVNSLIRLPMASPTGSPVRRDAIKRMEQNYLNARGGKLGVFQVTI